MVMDKTMDRVLCYGVLCVDQIVRTDTYPPPDDHARILEEGQFIGGEAANSAAILARLGVPVTLRGNFVGADERGRFFLKAVRAIPDLECSGIGVKPGFQTPYAVIVSSRDGYRTILGSFSDMQSPTLNEVDFEGIGLLSVDPFLGAHALKAAESAKARGLPVLSIEVDPAGALAKICDVAINSAGFMRRHRTGKPEAMGARLLEAGIETAVITEGADGCLVFDAKEGDFYQPAFDVSVADSTGAGDAFRAGFIYGHLQKWELRDVVRFASAVAALNCGGIGGCAHAPSLEEVERLLEGS
jgi:sulfofructose kinase